ncbi:MAG TPA: secretion protein HlyD [Persephonella sp.]|uniref:Efflux system, membrane fusion protein n=1 Tax=Persephonella marina (strain DSM 14350 / EX-H1) TaxID=123214 RepID=C0QPJ7_PERMH|nr:MULTISPECIES: HlyD family efflux transporter periplasmic adaptor subunit [Persephonella]ACO03640.1 efflux system, membrane fusion protein [Persephonella marina EX-H1]HCB69792.1 secretion protein HlyD [Persephonella sp.]
MKILRQYWIGFLVILLLLTSIYLIYRKLSQKEIPPHLIVGVGRIDGDLISLNTKYAGRVKEIFVEEGKEVKKGEIIAVLSGKEYEAELEAVRYNIKAKEKEIEAKEIELEILKKTLPENVKKARSSLKINLSLLKELEKQIETVKSIVEKDEKDYERFKNLYEKKLIPEDRLEKIKLKLESDRNRLKGFLEKKKQIIQQIDAAKSSLKQAEATVKKIEILEKGISALKIGINALKSREKQLMVILDELKIRSPVDGYIVDKIADKGEVLGEGMVVATVIDPETLYLKIFVDTINNGKIKIGDRALIFLDAYPDRPIEARVVRISQRAEFTPKEVAVKEDRIQRVYAVHIKPLKVEPVLKLGLPAVGVISITGKGLPKSLKELPEI